MRSDTNQHSIAATKTKAIERIRRLRSSSRCSRNDICPPSSSSPDSFPSSNFFGKRGITVEWPRPEEFFLPLPLGEGRGEGWSVSSYAPSLTPPKGRGRNQACLNRLDQI